MSSWMTAREIAEAALAGLPRTERGVNGLAKREGWQSRKRKGRGGGLEFAVPSLPQSAQAELVLREQLTAPANDSAPTRSAARAPTAEAGVAESAATPVDIEALWEAYERSPTKTKEEARWRLGIVEAVARLVDQVGYTTTEAVEIVATQTETSVATIWRWRRAVADMPRTAWEPALAPGKRGGRPREEIHPEIRELFLADWLRSAGPSLEACYRRLQPIAEERGLPLPSLKTLRRMIDREVPADVQVLLRQGRDAVARRYPAQRRSRAGLTAMEVVNADFHKFDVFVQWPDGTIARPQVCAFQDVFSGKILSWRIALHPSAGGVRLAFADLAREYGLPEHCVVDNGREFASKWITGRAPNRYRFKIREDEPSGLLVSWGIQVHWTQPYSGQSKPIERAFRDLCEDISRHPLCEGAYTGSGPERKPHTYGSKAVPIDDFVALVDQQIPLHNARLGRRSEVAAGRSFDEVFAASLARMPARRASERQLAKLLLAAEGVTADRITGEISLMGNRYWSPQIQAADLSGRKVIARFDPAHLDRPLQVYTLDDRFVAEAPLLEAAGFLDADAARAHGRDKRAYVKATRAQAEALRRLDARALAAIHRPAPAEPPAPAPAGDGKVVRPAFGAGATPPPKKPKQRWTQEEWDEAVLSGADRLNGSRSGSQ